MKVALILALAGAVEANSGSLATPPPTIITIKSSPLCNAVRNAVAPAIVGLMVQDHAIAQTNVVMRDMARMQGMGGTTWVDFENHQMLRAVDIIAQNNIKIHQMLDHLAAL